MVFITVLSALIIISAIIGVVYAIKTAPARKELKAKKKAQELEANDPIKQLARSKEIERQAANKWLDDLNELVPNNDFNIRIVKDSHGCLRRGKSNTTITGIGFQEGEHVRVEGWAYGADQYNKGDNIWFRVTKNGVTGWIWAIHFEKNSLNIELLRDLNEYDTN